MVARSLTGEIGNYPVVETIHKNNICHIVKAPAPVDIRIRKKAEKLGRDVMQYLGGAGVFAIEVFLDKNILNLGDLKYICSPNCRLKSDSLALVEKDKE